MALEHVQELFDFIQQSPSCFHVIENVKKQLTEQGFEELCENKNWQIKEGGAVLAQPRYAVSLQ